VAVTWGLGGIIVNAARGVIVDHQGTPFLYLIFFVLSAAASLLFAITQNFQTRKMKSGIVGHNV
jgi:PPP family 3-phenylpropionic acid transporter